MYLTVTHPPPKANKAMKSHKTAFGVRRTQKSDSGPFLVPRRIQNLLNYQSALARTMYKIFLPAQIAGVLPLILIENQAKLSFIVLLFSAVGQFIVSSVIFYKAAKLFLAGVSSSSNTTPMLKNGIGALNYAEEAAKTITVMYVLISTITFCMYRRKFASIIRRVITVKVLTSQIGLDPPLRARWLPMMLHVPLAMAAIIEFHNAREISTVLSLVVRYSCEIMVGTIVVFFIQLLYLVESTLGYLNDHLLKLTTTDHPDKYKKLSVMSDCHHHLCSACHFINTFHSFPLLFLYFSVFVNLVVLIFKTISVLASLSLTGILTFGTVLTSYIARSWYVVYICSRTSDQTKLFNKNLFEMILFDPTEESTVYVKKLMLHLEMKREFEFHAKGFFTVDYPLLHSIAAVATSYLVILVQTSNK
ncbi:hypothetical protein GE061_005909 [Apolygus lucorum]|uniref:Gustatory receptor n=1 Tax=Apolygus lucorum TaxID=248454 RepID=A0A8S9WU09_APOLU|nr:hypothetical protein GE061_005909 [Apolygus lucorum]